MGLLLLIVVLACILAFVPGIPQIGRVFLMIAIGVLCFVVMMDIIGVNWDLGRIGWRSGLRC